MGWTLHQGDCLEVMRALPDDSVDLVVVDPPYFRAIDAEWDRKWRSAAEFVGWVGLLCEQWRRLLRGNGSLYCFASPQMAAQVEVEIGRWFDVLNHIVWYKPANRSQKAKKEDLRSYFPVTERIIFAEQRGADRAAKGEAGYELQCDRLKGFVFEPLRAYLDGERQRAGVTPRQIMDYFEAQGWPKYVTARHSFTQSQWELPTEENYNRLRQAFHDLNHGGEYLRRDYEYLRRDYEYLRRDYEDLRRDYEDLRRDYEDLRRPFSVTASTLHTDVWTMNAPPSNDRLHPTQKPQGMIQQMVRASTKPGGVVLDCCMGSGTTGAACVMEGREFVGIELDAGYFEIAKRRIEGAQPPLLALVE